MRTPNINLDELIEEVKHLREEDEALDKTRAQAKVKQRDVRLRVGALVSQLDESEIPVLAARSGYPDSRLKAFARVRAAWPDGSFPADIGYTPLEELARHPDRFTLIRPGMSKRDAREARGGMVDTPSRWSPQVKADFVREAMSDPTVARRIADDVQTRAHLARAESEAYHERRSLRDLEPGRKVERHRLAQDEVERLLDNARYALNRALDVAMDADLSEDVLLAIRNGSFATVEESVTWMREFLASGDTTFEAALHELLNNSQEN